MDLKQETILNGIQKQVFLDRYSLKDEKGEPKELVPEQMWKRVAAAAAKSEKTLGLRRIWTEKFYEVMLDFKFCPAGRILSAAGTGTEATLITVTLFPLQRTLERELSKLWNT